MSAGFHETFAEMYPLAMHNIPHRSKLLCYRPSPDDGDIIRHQLQNNNVLLLGKFRKSNLKIGYYLSHSLPSYLVLVVRSARIDAFVATPSDGIE